MRNVYLVYVKDDDDEERRVVDSVWMDPTNASNRLSECGWGFTMTMKVEDWKQDVEVE